MIKKNIYKLVCIFLLFPFIGCSQRAEDELDNDLVLWYKNPAKKWTDAFPLGNGRLAAMNFGGTTVAKFQLNE